MADNKIKINESREFIVKDSLFGMNLEVTRTTFFGGLGSQMLNNRKLFAGETFPTGWICENYTYVKDNDDHSICRSHYLTLHKNGSMSTAGKQISLLKGESYDVVINVYTKTSSKVSVSINDKIIKSLDISKSEGTHTKIAFSFVADEDVNNGSFAFATTEELDVFTLSLMESNNFHGLRRDVLEKIKELKPYSLRYPGGCNADHFEWEESLKEPDFRKPTSAHLLDGYKDFLYPQTFHQDCEDWGINEFYEICRYVGTKAEYTMRMLSWTDVQEAVNVVEYCNGSEKTTYGAKRAALGYKEPFNIKYWYVGNEIYYSGYGLEFDGALSARITNNYIKKMREVDPTIEVCIGIAADDRLRKWTKDYIDNLNLDAIEYYSYHEYARVWYTTKETFENMYIDNTDFGFVFFKDVVFPNGEYDKHLFNYDEWNHMWGYPCSSHKLFSNALQFHFILRNEEKYRINDARYFHPVNEGMILVEGSKCRVQSSGFWYMLMNNHKNAPYHSTSCENKKLDIVCSEQQDGSYFLSIVNRSDEPEVVSFDDNFKLLSSTLFKVNSFQDEVDDVSIIENPKDLTITGKSVLFVRLSK